MVQFTRFAFISYIFRYEYPRGRVSPFRNLRVNAYLPANRSLSQAITSFFAYHRQGIHHMLLFTWPYNFDLFSQEEIKLFQSSFLSGLSPDALCRNVNNSLVFHHQENDSSLLKFKTLFKFALTQSKLSSEARLHLHAFPLITLISTLWIVKEQPWLLHKKSTTKKPHY